MNCEMLFGLSQADSRASAVRRTFSNTSFSDIHEALKKEQVCEVVEARCVCGVKLIFA